MGGGIDVSIESKRFTDTTVLRNLVFHVDSGEVLCIVGPSGAGKSTLLGMLAGVDDTYSGRIDAENRRAPGVMFQQPRLMPWLTVLDNVMLPFADDSKALRKRAVDMLCTLDLDTVADAFPQQLSLGMQRRIALVRALLPEPDLLLLDEPFVSLDAPMANRARALFLREQRRNAATTILSTHDLREAAMLGRRLVFLSDLPACVALDVTVDADVRDERAADRFCRELMLQHPALLQGRVAEGVRLAK